MCKREGCRDPLRRLVPVAWEVGEKVWGAGRGGGRSSPLPSGGGGGGRERGTRDRALVQWQSEDQSGLRNRAAKWPERTKLNNCPVTYIY